MFSDEVKPLDKPREKPNQIDISLYSESELLVLRGRIDQLLPKMNLKDINLESELMLQYHTVKTFQNEVLSAGSAEITGRAPILNACASSLTTLAKLQIEIYSSERFKTVEGLMVKHMKDLPVEVADAFIDEYEALK